MKTKLILAIALASMPLAAAEAMDLATFLDKAGPLEKKGALAVFSSDFKLLSREVQTASEHLRAERLAARKAGRTPPYCPPEKGGMGPKELLAELRAIPAAQRSRLAVKDGLRAVFARKYPCPA